MRKFRTAALALASVMLVCAVGCNKNEPEESSSSSLSSSSSSGYGDDAEIGKNKIEVALSEGTDLNNTTFTLNRVIDSGRRLEGLKYIYLDVTIKNNSDMDYETSGLNNFYLMLDDGTEVFTDVRADIYAKKSLPGYEKLMNIAAGSEYSNYVGFVLDEKISDFTVCFFATADNGDRSSVIQCKISEKDITPAPEGMFTETES